MYSYMYEFTRISICITEFKHNIENAGINITDGKNNWLNEIPVLKSEYQGIDTYLLTLIMDIASRFGEPERLVSSQIDEFEKTKYACD
jgi:hypothetical protein